MDALTLHRLHFGSTITYRPFTDITFFWRAWPNPGSQFTRFTRVVVAAAVIDALDDLNLKYPKVSEEKLKELAAAKRVLEGGK